MTNEMILENGKKRRFTMVGGYPVFYVTEADCALCADCADEAEEKTTGHVNWGSDDLDCFECSNKIKSAYGINVSQ